MPEQPESLLELSGIEELQNDRDTLHKKSVVVSKVDIEVLEEDSKQKHKEIIELSKAASENENKIRDSYPYRRAEADVFNDRLHGFKDRGNKASLKYYNDQIMDGYKPVIKAREKKEKIDEKIDSYYHSTSDIDELNSKITTHLNSSIKNSTDKISDLENKVDKEKENIDAEIKKLSEELEKQKQIENKNKAIFYGQTKKEQEAIITQQNLSNRINELTSKFKEISSPDNKDIKDLAAEKQNLDKAQKILAQETDKQDAIKKERANFPKEMNPQKYVEEIAKEMRELRTKTPQQKEDFITKIQNTSPKVLTTKFGEPPKTLLHLASELNQKEVGIALLNSPAKFNKSDMKEALKIAKIHRTPEQKKVLTTHNDNQTHEEVKEVTKAAMHSMRDSLSSQSSQAPLPNIKNHSKDVVVSQR